MSPEYHARYFQEHKEQFAEYRRRHRERNPDRTLEHRKARLSNYNITPGDYEVLLAKQGGVCAICFQTNKGKQLAVDHDHACCSGEKSCGKCIRGLLCTRCNSVLGFIEDSLEILLSMVHYLKGESK
jgi:hypothetical protein